MPRRKFNEPERIRDVLVKEGEALFTRYGLKKTTLEEITAASGIGKGSFYKFFGSKEELYFEVLERQEERLQEQLISRVLPLMKNPEEFIRELIKEGFKIIEEYPLIQYILDSGTYRNLANKLPEEKLQAHQKHDEERLLPLISRLQEQGGVVRVDPGLIAALLRGIFMLALHRREIGEKEFNRVIDLLAETMGRGLARQNGEKA
ncbi:MAG: TetR/AcrR family transcriptional regulator [Spirochaetia bacterium]